MWQVAAADGVVVLAAAAHVLLAWWTRQRFHRESSTADVVLAYGLIPRGLVGALVLIWVAVLTTSGALGNRSDSLFENVAGNAIFLLALVGPIWALAVEFAGTEYQVTSSGIRKHSPWTRNFDVRWDEIDSYAINGASGWLVIRARRGKIRIHELIQGRGEMLVALNEHVRAREVLS